MDSNNLYIYCGMGLSESQLLAIQSAAIDEITKGVTITSLNVPGMSSTFAQNSAPELRYKAAQMALNQIDPTSYPTPVINQTLGWTI